jgi:hypothetical protein
VTLEAKSPSPDKPLPTAISASGGEISPIFDSLSPVGIKVPSVEAEYMLWFVKGTRAFFPVASTGDAMGVNTGTQTLGDTPIGQGPVSGGRFTFGYWELEHNAWVPERSIPSLGGEFRVFFIGARSADFLADTNTSLFRPFFDINNRMESTFPVALPGVSTGSIDAHGKVSMWGAELNLWKNIYYNSPGTTCAVDVMAGLRYLNGNSDLNVHSITAFNPTIAATSPFASFAGNRLDVTDSFGTRNHFFGGQFGIKAKGWFLENLSVEGSLRVALGNTAQELTINGQQVRTFPNGSTVISPAGLLALPSNIGTFHFNQFTQVPEGDVKLLWPVTSQLTLSVGFSALYWNRVLRATDQIDRALDVTQIPNFIPPAGTVPTGLGRPAVPFRAQTDLWLLGISFGAEIKW